MKSFKFYKDQMGRWFVDLPEWEGDISELEMVLGADTMLDILAQGENEVSLAIAIEPFDGYHYKLIKNDNKCTEGGAWYNFFSQLHHLDYEGFEVWLCHVNKFVFGIHPENIYIK